MYHPWIPNSSRISEMLRETGYSSIEELYSDIPAGARFKGDWDSLPIGAGRPLSEAEVALVMEDKLSRVRVYRDPPPFMGGGAWPRLVPAVIEEVVRRGEFLTAYTPYQAEINQGLMQALFEYQSLMAELLEMEVVNSSMYDWSTALAEAMLMALRVSRGSKRVLLPETMNPLHRRVVETYLSPHGAQILEYPVDMETGQPVMEAVEDLSRSGLAALYAEQPSFTGVVVEDLEALGEIAHRHGGLFVVGVEPISASVLKPPGRVGADVAVGEGQPLGIGLNYGGPYLGIFAVRWDLRLVRQMPGRIIGLTRDSEGRRAYAMILQTREQHIRRERATSNITTNEALMAIAAAAYMALLGGEGLRRVAEVSWYNSHYAAKRLSEVPGVRSPLFASEFISDFTVRLPVGARRVREMLRDRGVLFGIPLEDSFKWSTRGDVLLAVTEAHSKRHIDYMVEQVSEVIGEVGGV